MTDVLSEAEIQSLRRHLSYGNVAVGAYPYTPDGFYEVFHNVIAPNLETGAETTATTAIAAASTTAVTPVAMTAIAVNTRLVVDVGDEAEIVVVKSVTATTFTAKFAVAHPASGYPIAVQSGLAELRMLLHSADKIRRTLGGSSITGSAGLQSIDKGDVVWFAPGAALASTREQYAEIVTQISELIRVPGPSKGRHSVTTESY